MNALPPGAFHVMAKPTGPLCNLDCSYCFYLEKERLYPGRTTHAAWAMADEVLESYIRQYIEAQQVGVVSFAWQGGEPTLLGLDYFERVVTLQEKHAGGKRVENALQTNGVLLDERWAAFLAENGFLVGLSLDGPRELHDRYRVDKGGRPTFDAVMRGLSLLRKHGVRFNTLTCVQRHNSQAPLAVYRFLKDCGSTFTQFIPVVERIAPAGPAGLRLVPPAFGEGASVSEWSVEPLQYGRFLCEVFDEWVRRDVGRVFVQVFDTALESWRESPGGLCVFKQTCGTALALEHNGDLYSCDHYVYPENRLGNIQQEPLVSLVGSAQQRRFAEHKREGLPRHCRECRVRFACNGACPKHRFARAPDGEWGLNYLCPGYTLFFTHVEPYMRFMAQGLRQGRAPSKVMKWAREKAPPPGGAKSRRNDPCPCGRGRIYKHCCARRG